MPLRTAACHCDQPLLHHLLNSLAWVLSVVLLIALPCSPCHSDEPANPGSGDPGLGDQIQRFSADRDSLRFKYREPLSPLRRQRMVEFYRTHLMDLKTNGSAALSVASRVDRALLRGELEYQLAAAKLERRRDERAAALLPEVDRLVDLLEQHEKHHELDPRATAALYDTVADSIAVLPAEFLERQANDQLSGEDRSTALRAAEAASQLLRRLDDLHTFYQGYDPMYSWWCKAPRDRLTDSLRSAQSALRAAGGDSADPDKIIGQPIGEEALRIELRHEMIPYTPAELIEIAEREFEWCDAQMLAASNEMGYGDDWRAAMDAVKEKHVAPGGQPAMIHALADEAVAFLKQHDLVTVPPLCEESWRMEMMTPDRQRLNPYFLGGDTIIVSYPTDTMTHGEKLMSMRGNNEHFARATVQHELIPGHHLQGFMMDRYRPYRQAFRTPFWIEGWALYWEMLLWDRGFAKSPEDRVGMLFWRKHRCARIIFSLGYQLGRMTPEQCVDYLVERVGHDRRNAAAEVRRSVMGGYDPLYQAAYMLGGLQLRALRRELVESGKMTDRQFHDAVLREGPIPIAMVRAMLTGQVPEEGAEDQWRFAD